MGSLVDPEFWNGRSVVLTGHTGFKGSWCSLWLQAMGAEVVGYALEPPTKPNLFEAADVRRGMVHEIGDVRNLEKLCRVVKEHRPEVVIHMAAQSLVRASFIDPVSTYSTNVMGTVNVLEAVRNTCGVRAVVCVTSDKCYENREWIWGYRENDPMGGRDPYSSSKGCAELVVAAWRDSYASQGVERAHRPALASARAGNVIGGGDWAEDRLLPDIMRGLMDGQAVSIRNPSATRPWQHVLDPLSGYLLLAERLYNEGSAYTGGWNFGPLEGGSTTVSWIIAEISRLWGRDVKWEHSASSELSEARSLKLDSSKAMTSLGWRPRLDLRTALDWVVEWYKAFQHDPQQIRQVTLRQINGYQGIE